MLKNSHREDVKFLIETLKKNTGRDYTTYLNNISRELVDVMVSIVSSSLNSCSKIVEILSTTTSSNETMRRMEDLYDKIFSGTFGSIDAPATETLTPKTKTVDAPVVNSEPATVDVPAPTPVVEPVVETVVENEEKPDSAPVVEDAPDAPVAEEAPVEEAPVVKTTTKKTTKTVTE